MPCSTRGTVVRAKINGVQVLKAPKDGSGVVATLQRDEELVYLGEEKDGYIKVLSPAGEGWVRRVVVMR